MKRVIICIDETREVYRVAGTGNVLRQEVWVDGHEVAQGTVSYWALQARLEGLLTRPQGRIVSVAAGSLHAATGPVGRLSRQAAREIALEALKFL